MHIRIERTKELTEKPSPDALGFGRHFSPHMFRRRFEAPSGWLSAAITPREPLVLDPAASVLHYGQAVFEGLKAFRRSDGRVHLFRPEAHAKRFVGSAQRICLPEVPVADFLRA